MKTKLIYLLVVASLAITSCSKKDKPTDVLPSNTCGVTNPVEDLAWLKDRISYFKASGVKSVYIWQTEYQGQTIFVLSTCDETDDPILSAYGCEENMAITTDIMDYVHSITPEYIIWKPTNSTCNL